MPHYVGSRAPEGVTLTIRAGAGFDLSLVTSAEIVVRSPAGPALDWAWTIQSAEPRTIVLYHEYALDGSDVSIPGLYSFSGFLVTPSVRRRIRPVKIPYERYV